MDQRAPAQVAVISGARVGVLAVAGGLVAAGLLAVANDPASLASALSRVRPQSPEARQVLELLEAAGKAPNDAVALSMLDRAAARLEAAREISGDLRARVYGVKGEVHVRLWQYVEAEEAWQRAARHSQGVRRMGWLQRAADLQRVIEDGDRERQLHQDYVAAPGVGPASALTGHVAVIYVFVEDAGLGRWTARSREQASRQWNVAERWLMARARLYQSTVTFSRRAFLVDRNPFIKRETVIWKPGHRSSVATTVARLAAADIGGGTDIRGVVERLRREERASQAVLLLHLEREGRSFASRCHVTCGPDGEYAYVLESSRPKEWESMEHAQAHETLHLFGAADLYNIRDARQYAPRDIMHRSSRLLAASTLEPLTAYAVGLRPAPPVPTPFNVVTLK